MSGKRVSFASEALERKRQLNIRVSDEEYEAFEAAAKAAGLSLADWLRLNARIGAGLTRAPRP